MGSSSRRPCARLPHDVARAGAVGQQAGRLGRLGLQQQLLVVVMGGQHAECVGGRFGRAERRGAGIVEHAAQRPHARVAHETADHRLARARRQLRQLARHRRHVGQRVGRKQHQHAIHAGVVEQAVQDGLDALGRKRRIGNDRIGGGGVGFQHVGQRALRRRRQLRLQHRGVRADEVQRQLRRAAAVGEQRHPAAARTPGIAQHLDGREQLHEVAHPHRPGAPQRGIEHGIGAVGVGAAGLEHDDGLDAGGGAQRAHELARRPHVLDIQHDAVGAGIAGQVIEHLRQPHDRFVAQRYRDGKPDVHVFGPVHHRRHDGARLRHQRHPPGARQRRMLAEVQAGVRTLRPERARPEQFAAVFGRPGAAQRLGTARIRVGQLVGQQDHGPRRQGRQAPQRLGQHPGATHTSARSGRSPSATPAQAAGSSGAAPGAACTTVVRARRADGSTEVTGNRRSAMTTSEAGSNIGARTCRSI